MGSLNLFLVLVLTFGVTCHSAALLGQPPAPPPQTKAPVETPDTRLSNAKTVLVVHAGGNDIPYEVIKTTLEGWVRFTVVEVREKADLIIEVATSGGNSDTRVSSSDGPPLLTGRPEHSSSTSKNFSNSEITMAVYDAKTKRLLWKATDTAKNALKQTTRENNLVEAAERLASKFHDHLEPPRPKEQD